MQLRKWPVYFEIRDQPLAQCENVFIIEFIIIFYCITHNCNEALIPNILQIIDIKL